MAKGDSPKKSSGASARRRHKPRRRTTTVYFDRMVFLNASRDWDTHEIQYRAKDSSGFLMEWTKVIKKSTPPPASCSSETPIVGGNPAGLLLFKGAIKQGSTMQTFGEITASPDDVGGTFEVAVLVITNSSNNGTANWEVSFYNDGKLAGTDSGTIPMTAIGRRPAKRR